MSKNLEQDPLVQHMYDAMVTQAQSGGWTNGFEIRELAEDPWGLGFFDPERALFEAPDSKDDSIAHLQAMLFGGVRPRFIADDAWEGTLETFRKIYNNSAVKEFAEERSGNIICLYPHSMFADLGIGSGASHEVMSELDADHPFGGDDDPRHRQTVVLGRVVNLLRHTELGEGTELVTGESLALTEGFILPLAKVIATQSANGSSINGKHRIRNLLGADHVVATDGNKPSREALEKVTVHGGEVIHEAAQGSQLKYQKGSHPKSQLRVIPRVSDGTKSHIIHLNTLDEASARTMVAGIAMDCPSIDKKTGKIIAQNPSVAPVPEIWVPSEPDDIDIIMKAMALFFNQHKLSGYPEIRYGSAKANPNLSHGEVKRLEKITLTDLRD